MRVLLTRPAEDAQPFAERLAATGVDSLIAPMMRIVYPDGPAPDLTGVQALLFTSANGVRAFARRSGERDIAVLTVGDATAREAADAGFSGVESAGGDVGDLARLVSSRRAPGGGSLVHVAGSATAGDLSGALERAGFAYRRVVLYEAVMADRLPDAAAHALAQGLVDGVALFSPRTAAAFEARAVEAGLSPALAGVSAFALSGNVAKALTSERWRAIEVARTPTSDDLLEVVLDGAATG